MSTKKNLNQKEIMVEKEKENTNENKREFVRVNARRKNVKLFLDFSVVVFFCAFIEVSFECTQL